MHPRVIPSARQLAAWLRAQPPTRVVGRTWDAADNVVARAARALAPRLLVEPEVGAVAVQDRDGRILHEAQAPRWARRLLLQLEAQAPRPGTPVTAEEALRALRRVTRRRLTSPPPRGEEETMSWHALHNRYPDPPPPADRAEVRDDARVTVATFYRPAGVPVGTWREAVVVAALHLCDASGRDPARWTVQYGTEPAVTLLGRPA